MARKMRKINKKINLANGQQSDSDASKLRRATKENNVDIARALIDRGAGIEWPDFDGYTLLHSATEENSLDVAHLLIDRGADVDARGGGGDTFTCGIRFQLSRRSPSAD